MKNIIYTLLALVALVSCAYNPIIDTAGRSGTFSESKAVEITNDIQHCRTLAEENSSWFSNVGYWLSTPQMETKYQVIYKKCLANRGHSVLN